jgi:D-sedoheptulose 7-phosphate isomerase
MNISRVMKDGARLSAAFATHCGDRLQRAAEVCVQALGAGGTLLAFGNGGSAADAQHFTAELVNKFMRKRPALRALSLATDVAALTSIGNDVSFRAVFGRQVEALGRPGDIALALSTSGNSPNVVAALKKAKKMGLVTIGFTGRGGGAMAPFCDYLIDVPSTVTPRIQEIHLIALHLLAEEIEARFAAK